MQTAAAAKPVRSKMDMSAVFADLVTPLGLPLPEQEPARAAEEDALSMANNAPRALTAAMAFLARIQVASRARPRTLDAPAT
jgi:hypothetical protein